MNEMKKNFCLKCMNSLNEEEQLCPVCGADTANTWQEPYIPMGTVLRERYLVGRMIKKNMDSAVYIGYDFSEDKAIELREFMPDKICARAEDGVTLSPADEHTGIYGEYKQSYIQLWKNLMRFKGLPALFDVNDVFSLNNTVYAVTDHNDSTTFRKILNNIDIENNPMSLKRVKELIVPMLSTVESLHTANVVHRGISPDTLILSSDGSLKITGFAIPQLRTTKNSLMHWVCDGYAAVEQYNFSWQQGSWTDIYSIGALIYELLTGRIISKAPERLSDDSVHFTEKECQRIPESVRGLIRECLAVMPQDRIKSIAAIRNVFVPFDAPVSNVTRSVHTGRNLNTNVKVRTNEKNLPVKEAPPAEYVKPRQADAPTRTAAPGGVVISEERRLRQREQQRLEEIRHNEAVARQLALEEEKKLRQAQEEARQKQVIKEERKKRVRQSAVGGAAIKAKEKLTDTSRDIKKKSMDLFSKYPAVLSLIVGVCVVVASLVATLAIYGTVLFKYVDAPILDNCLSSFSFLPVNKQTETVAVKTYTVPDFRGFTKEAIETEAAYTKRFSLVFEYDYCNTVAAGFVFDQSIEQGELVEKDSVIIIYISKGIKMITMPDVSDMTAEEATAVLTEAGFTVITEKLDNNGLYKEGRIKAVSLTEGESYPDETEVVLKVWGEPIWETLSDLTQSTTGSSGDTPSDNGEGFDNRFDIPSIFDWIFSGFGR